MLQVGAIRIEEEENEEEECCYNKIKQNKKILKDKETLFQDKYI
jgi:hypothetical protein